MTVSMTSFYGLSAHSAAKEESLKQSPSSHGCLKEVMVQALIAEKPLQGGGCKYRNKVWDQQLFQNAVRNRSLFS